MTTSKFCENVISITLYSSRKSNPSWPCLTAINTVNLSFDLNELKTSVDNTTFLVQEFIYDEANIVNNRWNIIRSIDILYGSELDVLNMGSYKTATFVDIDAWIDEYESDGITLTKKSRYKWVNKSTNTTAGTEFNYHANSESLILGSTGTLINLNDLPCFCSNSIVL